MMKKYKTPLLVAAGVATLGLGGLGVASSASALSGNQNGESSLIDALVSKFNLNKSEVQQVFDQQHQARREEMMTKRLDRLKELLSSGKITQAQYDHIVAAWNKIDSILNAAGDPDELTDAQRQEIKNERNTLRTWLKEQGINRSMMGEPEHHEMRGRM